MQIQHRAGKFWGSDFLRQFIPISRNTHIFVYRFSDRNKYIHDEANKKQQRDFLKAGGVTFAPITNTHSNTAMVGYRWDPDLNCTSVTPYLHATDGTRLTAEEKGCEHYGVLESKEGDEVIQVIQKYGDHVRVRTLVVGDYQRFSPKLLSDIVEPRVKWSRVVREIAAYAGGDYPPQVDTRFNRVTVSEAEFRRSPYAMLLEDDISELFPY